MNYKLRPVKQKEKSEQTNGVINRRKLKDRQYNNTDKQKKDKKTMIHKTNS